VKRENKDRRNIREKGSDPAIMLMNKSTETIALNGDTTNNGKIIVGTK